MQDRLRSIPDSQDSQKNSYQIKVMTLADLSQGRTWESLPVISDCKNCTLTDLGQVIAPFVASDEVWEVRTNVLGSPQGNYYPALVRRLTINKQQAFDKAFLNGGQ